MVGGATRAAWFVALLVTIELRVPLRARAVASDELASVVEGPWSSLLWGDETAVNPPLFRALLRAVDPADAVSFGRTLAGVATFVAIGVVGVLAARAARERWAGAVAVVAFAGCFQVLRVSAEARSYPLAALAVAVWLLGLVASVDEEREGWARWAVVVGAALLPWLHYATVPILAAVIVALAVTPRWRPLVKLHLPAVLLALPLLPAVLGTSRARVPTPGRIGDSVAMVVSLGQRWPWRLGATPGDAVGPAVVTAVAVALAVLSWRRLTDGQRLLGVAAATALVAPAILGLVQYVRPPVGALAAVPVIALLASVSTTIPRGRPVAIAAVLVWFTLGTAAPLRSWLAHDPFQAVDALAADWRTLPPAPVWRLAPSSAVEGLAWRATGHTVRGLARDPSCPRGGPCVVLDGTRFEALGKGTPTGRAALVGPVRDVDTSGCVDVARQDALVVVDCPGGPHSW